jgi:hypothetical protein
LGDQAGEDRHIGELCARLVPFALL